MIPRTWHNILSFCSTIVYYILDEITFVLYIYINSMGDEMTLKRNAKGKHFTINLT